MATYKGEEINTKPTEAMAENAKRGLEWREEFGRGDTSEPIAGTVTYLYEISGKYWYRLAYDASDRPSGDGTAQYVFTNSGKTAVINLHVSETLDSTESQAAAAAALNAYDAPTKAELDSAVANLSTFDPTTDVVITDTESREASKADLSGIEDNLHTINEGVKKASLLILHTEDI